MRLADWEDFAERTLWQVAAGNTDRSYGDICRKLDVMMVGSSDLGEHSNERYAELESVRKFYEDARRKDIVLLRLGTGQILSIGEIVDDEPQQLSAFADVDGWDLRHVRRVRWFADSARDFPVRTLGGQARRFARVGVPIIREWAASLDVEDEQLTRPLTELPKEVPQLSRSELGRRLSVKGFPSEQIDKLMQTFVSLEQVASWYKDEIRRSKRKPSEYEAVAYLVVPLLSALGWSQQTAAIEWRNIDVALFEETPRDDSTLSCVVEAKLLDSSVFSPRHQAKRYALLPGRKKCRRLIVTDGIRYTLHKKVGEDFELSAYLNVLDIRERYPIFGCEGAVHALLGMAR